MKRLLLGATLLSTILCAQIAAAAPIITLTVSADGATATQCSAGSVGVSSFSGNTCTVVSTTGTVGFVSFVSNYGSWFSDAHIGSGNGTDPLSRSQPALWINSNASTQTAGTLTITLTAQNYSTPLGAFPLLSTASGTVGVGMSTSIDNYFDASNSGVAGVGINLLSADWVGFASGSVPSTQVDVTNGGLYSESWIQTITRTAASDGETRGAGVNGTLTQAAVPAPSPLALLGLGLLAIGFVSTRKRAI